MYKKNITSFVIALCLFSLISITIGYAFLERKMEFKGVTDVASTKWDVHFDNIQINKEKGTITSPASLNEDKTILNFAVTLNKPGDVYDFYVDVLNAGTIDAMVGVVPTINIPNKYAKLIEYKITYADGTPIKQNDLLLSGTLEDGNLVANKETLRVSVKYISSTTGDELPTSNLEALSVELELPYLQADDTAVGIERNKLYEMIAEKAVLDNEASTFVTSETGINHKAASSDTNGKGLYTLAATADDDYPVYYYRGDVTDNNVLFADICWKIVRTTETGGIKLLYNGLPTDGTCNNTERATALPGYVQYMLNSEPNGSYQNYMYGDFYYSKATKNISRTSDETLVFGNDVTYADGKYTLVNTFTTTAKKYNEGDNLTVANGYHYTCFNDQTECSEVYYGQSFYGTISYVTLKNGVNVQKFYDEYVGRSSKYSSNIKTVVDTWYKENMIDYEDNLEDSVWCVDRRYSDFNNSGWNKDVASNIAESYYFDIDKRFAYNSTLDIDLTCDVADSYTVKNTNGNGKFDYMTGLLTLDELALGGVMGTRSTYLHSGVEYWSMSPAPILSSTSAYFVSTSGGLLHTSVNDPTLYARPAVSLRNDILYSTGDGSSDNPFVIIER